MKQKLYSQQQRSQTHFWSVAEVLQLLILTVGDNGRRQTRGETVGQPLQHTAVDLDPTAVLLTRIADLVGPPAPRPVLSGAHAEPQVRSRTACITRRVGREQASANAPAELRFLHVAPSVQSFADHGDQRFNDHEGCLGRDEPARRP